MGTIGCDGDSMGIYWSYVGRTRQPSDDPAGADKPLLRTARSPALVTSLEPPAQATQGAAPGCPASTLEALAAMQGTAGWAGQSRVGALAGLASVAVGNALPLRLLRPPRELLVASGGLQAHGRRLALSLKAASGTGRRSGGAHGLRRSRFQCVGQARRSAGRTPLGHPHRTPVRWRQGARWESRAAPHAASGGPTETGWLGGLTCSVGRGRPGHRPWQAGRCPGRWPGWGVQRLRRGSTRRCAGG